MDSQAIEHTKRLTNQRTIQIIDHTYAQEIQPLSFLCADSEEAGSSQMCVALSSVPSKRIVLKHITNFLPTFDLPLSKCTQ